jgi:hypothetical protein
VKATVELDASNRIILSRELRRAAAAENQKPFGFITAKGAKTTKRKQFFL